MVYNKKQLNTPCKCGHVRWSHDHICYIPYRVYIDCKYCNCKKFEEA